MAMARFKNGWVKLYRKAALGDINSNFTRGGLFSSLIAMANIQSSIVEWKGRPRKLEPGEIVTSLRELADLGGVDPKTVSKHLNYLSLRDTIILEKSKNGVLIKFVNWEMYRGLDAEGSVQDPHAMDDGMAFGMAIGVPHIRERKNIRKREYTCEFDFEAFVLKLSSKISIVGSNARKRFVDQIKTQSDYDSLLTASDNYMAMLEIEAWRTPKTSIETFLGTKASGFFWRTFINLDLSALKSKTKNIAFARTADSEPDQWLVAADMIFSVAKRHGFRFDESARRELGEDWEKIVKEAFGGFQVIGQMPDNEFRTRTMARKLKSASEDLARENTQEVG